jgi:oligoendopeptidase F
MFSAVRAKMKIIWRMRMNRLSVLFSQRRATVLLLFTALLSLAFGQDRFVAIQPEQTAQYHINFARIFFASPEAEKAERAKLEATLKDLESLKGKIERSADNLQRALQLNDRVQIQFQRHYSYLYLRNAVNTKDETSLAESSALEAEVTARTAFLKQELMQLADQPLAAFVAQQPSLKKYLFAIESLRRYRPYTLSLKEEELLSATEPLNNDWQYELYKKLIAHTPFGTVRSTPGPKAREEGFKLGYAGFASQRDLYAFTLMRLAAAGTRMAQLRHYEDAASRAYFGRYWSKVEVNDLLEQLTRQADLYKRYQRLRADHVKKISGSEDVNLWDLSVRPAGLQLPRFTIDQASQIMRDALAPLGTEYGGELARLLDPTNGRMDIVPGINRKSGGFSRGFIGFDSVFYSAGFTGSYNDVRVLTHESTHAIHRQLMNRNHPGYASGPNYLFESFAIFNELLLPDYLCRHETDPLRQQYFAEQFLEGKGMIMFVVAPEAALEQAIYEGVAQGSIKGADDLDALTKRIYSEFSIWPKKHDELKYQWMNIPLMYEDPFYDINYIYGGLLALKFYELYTRDPKQFIPRYLALMSNGFDAPPSALLKRFLDIDLNDPRLVSDACRILEGKVQQLEAIYSAQDGK